MKKFFTLKITNIICSVAALVFMWLIWIIAYYAAGNPLIVPSFTETASAFFRYLGDGAFWTAVGNSLARTLLSFVVSFILAALFAVLASLGRGFKAFFKPVTVIIRTLPTMAALLIILKITSGSRTFSPVIVTCFVLFPMIYSQLIAAIEGIDSGIKEMAKFYCVKKTDKIFKIYLPLISPSVFSETGANLSLGLKVMVSSEVLVNTARGLGGMMQENGMAAGVANLAALTVAAVILGLLLEFALSFLPLINRKWRGEGAR